MLITKELLKQKGVSGSTIAKIEAFGILGLESTDLVFSTSVKSLKKTVSHLNALTKNSQEVTFSSEGWQYTYDALGRIKKEEGPIEIFRNFLYHSDGRKNRINGNDGYFKRWIYDKKNDLRLKKLRETDRPTKTYLYDKKGKLTHTKDAGGVKMPVTQHGNPEALDLNNGATCTWTYNSFDKPVTQTGPGDLTKDYEYDSEGRVTKLTVSNGLVNTWTYNTDGNLTNFDSSNGFHRTITYDAQGIKLTETTATGYSFNAEDPLPDDYIGLVKSGEDVLIGVKFKQV